MRKLFRTLVVTLITLSLAVSIIGCGSSSKDSSKEGSVAVEKSSSAEQSTVKEVPKEPVTLSLYGKPFPVTITSGVQDDPVAKEIARVTGVTMSVEAQPDDQKLAALLASGDLPDILVTDKAKLKQLLEGNNVVELDKLVEDNGKDIKKIYNDNLTFSKKFLSNDTNKLFVIPAGHTLKGKIGFGGAGVYIRWDYYKELGYPEVKTNDQLLDVLAQMQKAHPTNEDGKKVYGLSQWFEWPGLWAYSLLTGEYRGKYGIGTLEVSIDTLDAVAKFSDENSGMWQSANFFYKANKMGLLDPESLTQKYDNALQKAQANRILCSLVGWPTGNTNQAYQKAGEAKGFMLLPPPAEQQAMNMVGGGKYGSPDNLWCISKTCKTPERAMDLINYLFSEEGGMTIFNGVKGQTWNIEDGKAKLTPEAIKSFKEDLNFALTSGAGKYQNYSGMWNDAIAENGQYIWLMNEPEVEKNYLSALEKDYAAHFNITIPTEIFAKNIKFPNLDGAYPALVDTAPDDIKRLDDKISNYLTTNMPRLIYAKSDEEFNKIKTDLIAECKKMGVDQSSDFWLKAWQKSKDLVKTLGN